MQCYNCQTMIDINRAIELEEFLKLAANKLSRRLNVQSNILFKLLINKEKAGSTAINSEIAIPHIIIDGEHTFNILLVRCNEGINFSEKAPMVNAVFVLAGTKDERNFHLRALSNIAEIVQDHHFERRWLRAKNERALRNVVLMGKRSRHK